MNRDLIGFSECGKHFAYCGQDGKLKVWDAVTGVLKQEYVPNVHLSYPCTTLVWITFAKSSVLPWKSRKRKLEGKAKKVIALGTLKGSIALYSLSEGNVVVNLDASHSPVNSISWSKNAGLFSLSGGVVAHWDLASKSVKSKWKCGKKAENISQLVVSDDGELCVTAGYGLQLWQVKTQTLLKSFIGHAGQVMSLALVANNYVLSSAENDREISAWSLTTDSEHPVARFALSDSLSCQMSVTEESNGCIHLAGVTKSGSLHVYHQQLNGQCKKAIKPSTTVEIATDKAESSVQPIPVVGAYFVSPTSVSIAYGYLPKFSFESVDVREGCDKHIYLVRSESRKPVVNNLKVEETISEDVEYVNGSVKRKLDDDPIDVPMEERLGNLCIDQTEGSSMKPSPHNMAQLLVQGLESKDKSLLESVLFRREPQVISDTVSRLPLRALGPLIKELTNLLQGKTLVSMLATAWLKCVLATHAGQLLSDTRTQSSLAGLHSLVESRLTVLPPLASLSGRLDLLLNQLEQPTATQSSAGFDPLVVYQDEGMGTFYCLIHIYT
ncbi:hypothetical protein AAG570_001067 [Ranatra chinensis]|uniref:Small-subunit processome Utp12 domain-containing protein n=1 Tax=Ranatra chinensis TaxID=642074 RepID=A0ABD0YYY5_9HEMI